MSYRDMMVIDWVSGLDIGVAEITLDSHEVEKAKLEQYIDAIDVDLGTLSNAISAIRGEIEELDEDSEERALLESELRQLRTERDNLINAKADHNARIKEIDIARPFLQAKADELEEIRQQEVQVYSDDGGYELVIDGEKITVPPDEPPDEEDEEDEEEEGGE